jgi:hypothetical protein
VNRVTNSVRLMRSLGTMHWEANEWADAAKMFRHALVYWPEHSETHGDLAYAMDQGGVNASGVVDECVRPFPHCFFVTSCACTLLPSRVSPTSTSITTAWPLRG